MGTEIKAIDIASTTYAFQLVGTPPTFTLLNGVQVGAGFFNRVGSRIEMKNIHIRGIIENIATSISSYGRMLIVYDRQPNGAAPAITEVLQSRDQTGTAATSSQSEINLDQRDRFVILRDKQWYLPPVTNTANVLTNGPTYPAGESENTWEINEFIKMKGLVTHYKSSSNPTTIADINTGAVYLLFIQNQSASTYQARVGIRVRFLDL